MTTIDTREHVAMPGRPGRHPAQLIALVVGILYLAVGILGFAVTGFTGWVVDTNESFLDFDLNGFHNIVHIGVGLILILASTSPAPGITQGVLIGGGLVYILAAFLGFFTPAVEHLLSLDSRTDPENFLHLFSGLAAIVAGLIGPTEEAPASRVGPAGAMATPQPTGPVRPDEPGEAARRDPYREGEPGGMQRRW